MVEGQQHEGIKMAWKLSRHESHRKFMGHPQTWDSFRTNQQATNHKKWADRTAGQGVVLQRKDKLEFEKPLLKACLTGSKLWKPPREDKLNT